MNPDTDTDTDIVVQFFQTPEGAELLASGFLADLGGDPEVYDLSGVTEPDDDQMATALSEFMTQASAAGTLDPDVARAVTSGKVDWQTAWPMAMMGLF